MSNRSTPCTRDLPVHSMPAVSLPIPKIARSASSSQSPAKMALIAGHDHYRRPDTLNQVVRRQRCDGLSAASGVVTCGRKKSMTRFEGTPPEDSPRNGKNRWPPRLPSPNYQYRTTTIPRIDSGIELRLGCALFQVELLESSLEFLGGCWSPRTRKPLLRRCGVQLQWTWLTPVNSGREEKRLTGPTSAGDVPSADGEGQLQFRAMLKFDGHGAAQECIGA